MLFQYKCNLTLQIEIRSKPLSLSSLYYVYSPCYVPVGTRAKRSKSKRLIRVPSLTFHRLKSVWVPHITRIVKAVFVTVKNSSENKRVIRGSKISSIYKWL